MLLPDLCQGAFPADPFYQSRGKSYPFTALPEEPSVILVQECGEILQAAMICTEGRLPFPASIPPFKVNGTERLVYKPGQRHGIPKQEYAGLIAA